MKFDIRRWLMAVALVTTLAAAAVAGTFLAPSASGLTFGIVYHVVQKNNNIAACGKFFPAYIIRDPNGVQTTVAGVTSLPVGSDFMLTSSSTVSGCPTWGHYTF